MITGPGKYRRRDGNIVDVTREDFTSGLGSYKWVGRASPSGIATGYSVDGKCCTMPDCGIALVERLTAGVEPMSLLQIQSFIDDLLADSTAEVEVTLRDLGPRWVDRPNGRSPEFDFSNFNYRIKDKPVECWVNVYPNRISNCTYLSEDHALEQAKADCIRTVRLVESK